MGRATAISDENSTGERVPPVEVPCLFCGRLLEPRPGKGRPRTYCGEACRIAQRSMNALGGALSEVRFATAEHARTFRGNVMSMVNEHVNQQDH